jgi:hypothetical protein
VRNMITDDMVLKALKELNRNSILAAIKSYKKRYPLNDYKNWQENGNFKYAIVVNRELYPPKYIIEIATGIDAICFGVFYSERPYSVYPVFEREGFKIIKKIHNRFVLDSRNISAREI